MSQWIIDTRTSLTFDGVVALRIRLISGSVAVLGAQDAPRLDVDSISGQPLLVTHEAGILTITYADLTWDGLLNWLRPQRHSATVTVTVPRECPVQLGVVTASAVISGISARTSIKSGSGSVIADGVTGSMSVHTMSADMDAQDVNGEMTFNTVSGDLTIAGGSLSRLDAKTISGRITADVDLAAAASVRAVSASGDVALRLPAATSTRVDLRSVSGRVETTFDELGAARKAGGIGGGASIAGALGTGAGELSVSTMSGVVSLLRRLPPEGTGAPGASAAGIRPAGRPPADSQQTSTTRTADESEGRAR
jgi:hypothetical protein